MFNEHPTNRVIWDMDPDEVKFRTLEMRHQIAKAIWIFELDTNQRVTNVIIKRVPGRKDPIVEVQVIKEM
jgi:hypothetical protein